MKRFLLPVALAAQVVLSFPYQNDTRYHQYPGYQYYQDSNGRAGYVYTGQPLDTQQPASRFVLDTRRGRSSYFESNTGNMTIIIPTDNEDSDSED